LSKLKETSSPNSKQLNDSDYLKCVSFLNTKAKEDSKYSES